MSPRTKRSLVQAASLASVALFGAFQAHGALFVDLRPGAGLDATYDATSHTYTVVIDPAALPATAPEIKMYLRVVGSDTNANNEGVTFAKYPIYSSVSSTAGAAVLGSLSQATILSPFDGSGYQRGTTAEFSPVADTIGDVGWKAGTALPVSGVTDLTPTVGPRSGTALTSGGTSGQTASITPWGSQTGAGWEWEAGSVFFNISGTNASASAESFTKFQAYTWGGSATGNPASWKEDGANKLSTTSTAAYYTGTTIQFVLLQSGGGNDSMLTALPTTVNLGKVIVGDPIPAGQVAPVMVSNASATSDGKFTTTGAGGGFGPDGTVVAGGQTQILVGSSATPTVVGAATPVGSVLIHNTENSKDLDDTVSIVADVLARDSASKLDVPGPATLDFGGKVLVGGTLGGKVAVQNLAATYDTSVLPFNADAGVIVGSAQAVAGGSKVDVGFQVLAGAEVGSFTKKFQLKNTATTSYAPGLGSAQSFFDVFFDITVADAAETPSDGSFGPAYGSNVPQGGSYAGLSSKSAGRKGTEAKILDSQDAPVAGQVTMAWRVASDDEKAGTPSKFGVGFSSPAPKIISDVVDLNGIPEGTLYVLQMSYDDSAFVDEQGSANQGHIQIATYVEPSGPWVPAHALVGPNLGAYAGQPLVLGTWGVDTSANVVWQVLDHNSYFAVVPEPATIGLLSLSALALTMRRRRVNA